MNPTEKSGSFDYHRCADELRKSLTSLRTTAPDLIIEVKESDYPTINVLIESSQFLGQLTIWGPGMYAMNVIDVATGKETIEPDTTLTGDGIYRIREFLSYFTPS